ncbi:restriction endonuclease [Testudinibacter sp. TR-2022]|uniref:PmeII family type II restriction endonuclease n=1 Tax=Testudinibacter sp. TR-2022 TaxID=2585029 RepID=UPI00111B7B1B|nr:PmeII family type II restriction endonuclease [Testudinibacter sp. TR-2022]TNH03733.1 restriction endonuclease [Pasteurellaceae bacterium Phil31]TNH07232.1 restriction endonuclease [Testudinibacter sp. TR-2022]TNH12046.1 restriction endonuclease [Testudinibacter sp. TR-2022]TNH15533.1 restriction endonuclease [Testudinibacter sp. TR-2022]TNH15633.1 restriction endonuclease [Testudinibacter sp. TR-2022]
MSFNQKQKQDILNAAKTWFRETIASNHIKNTEKLIDPKEFNINPFLTVYLANFLTGNSNAESIARALLYPRVLGTSISTSFGQNMQSFINVIQNAVGSAASGMDIEFTDQIDGRKKYCQLKAGPNTINKDDVETIAGHFKAVRNLSRTNNLRIPNDDMIVGVLYGEPDDLSSHYKRITRQYDYDVIVGREFWHRLSGDEKFYYELIQAVGSVASEADFSEDLEQVVRKLAATDIVQKLSNHE